MIRDLFGGKAARFAVGLMVASALVLAACGDDDDDEAASDETTAAEESSAEESGATEVTVTATEYEFELSDTPTTETETIVFENKGKDPHAFVYGQISEGFTVDEAVRLGGEEGSATTIIDGGAEAGKTVELPIETDVPPGEYVMLCPIEDKAGAHWKLGQLEELQVE